MICSVVVIGEHHLHEEPTRLSWFPHQPLAAPMEHVPHQSHVRLDTRRQKGISSSATISDLGLI